MWEGWEDPETDIGAEPTASGTRAVAELLQRERGGEFKLGALERRMQTK